jgi:hypothetical protein
MNASEAIKPLDLIDSSASHMIPLGFVLTMRHASVTPVLYARGRSGQNLQWILD